MFDAKRAAQLGFVCGATCTMASALGQGCQPRWVPDFVPGDFTGAVRAFVEFDDGSGMAVYAGGDFSAAPGGVTAAFVARHDGERWINAGAGLNANVYTFAVHDAGDGSGPALYAGGNFWFSRGDDVPPSFGVARWNGARWVAVGAGLQSVTALASFEDGSGSRLYATGMFSSIGGVTYRSIAAWDGAQWAPLGTGLRRTDGSPGTGYALVVYDDGNGAKLHVGGSFQTADGVACNGLARWDGVHFESVGGGVRFPTGSAASVRALRATTLGGPALLVGGAFTEAGGVAATNIALWNGSTFRALGSGLGPVDPTSGTSHVDCIAEFSGDLYAGGNFRDNSQGTTLDAIARFDGSSWRQIGHGGGGAIYAMAATESPAPRLLIGGSWFFAGWDGASFHVEGNGLNASVVRAKVADLGDGPALYAVGNFTLAGSVNARRVAKWDGHQWSALGDGFECGSGWWAMEQFNDGTGEALYVASRMLPAGCGGIFKWDGAAWSRLPNEHLMTVFLDMKSYDRGDGARLYLLGGYDSGSGLLYRLSYWDGHVWTYVGSGPAFSWPIGHLAVYSESRTGEPPRPHLFVNTSGDTFGGVHGPGLVRWDGYFFSSVSAAGGVVTCSGGDLRTMLAAPPIPPRPAALYIGEGGCLYSVGGLVVHSGLAAWDGVSWYEPGESAHLAGGGVAALASVNDGRGEALYLAGAMQLQPNGPYYLFLRFGTGGFEVVDTGANSDLDAKDLLPMDVDGRRCLFVLGNFRRLGGQPTGNIARLAFCPFCAADWNLDGALDSRDLFDFLDDFFASAADFNHSGGTTSQDFFDLLVAFFQGCG